MTYDEWVKFAGVMNDSEVREAWDYQQNKIEMLKERIAELEKRVSDLSWYESPDRMGGQFTQDEINNSEGWY